MVTRTTRVQTDDGPVIVGEEVLGTLSGETLGQKMENCVFLLKCFLMNIRQFKASVRNGSIIVPSDKYDEEITSISEQWGYLIDVSEALLETGLGEWIRGSRLWSEFNKLGEVCCEALESALTLIDSVEQKGESFHQKTFKKSASLTKSEKNGVDEK